MKERIACTAFTVFALMLGIGVAMADTRSDSESDPVADAGSSPRQVNLSRYNGTVTVSFSGSGSYDPDGGSLSYSWSFGSGAIPPYSTSVSASATYGSWGNRTVSLTVTDDEGARDTDTVELRVKTYPTASAGSDKTVDVDTSVSFSGSGSDADGGSIQEYYWIFGDGSTSTGSSPSHTYTSVGNYTARLRVKDDEGDYGYDTLRVTVKAPPTCNDVGDKTVDAGESVSFSVSCSDPDGGTLSYAWSFGDGGTGTGSTASNTYDSHGTYSGSVTATDDEGDTATESFTVTVKAPPTAEISGGNKSVWINRSTGFSGSGDDPDGGTVTYSWSFGSGAYDISGATTSSASCKYNSVGAKTVTLTVTDDEGKTASDSITVTVVSRPPIAIPGSNKTVNPRVLVSFSGSGRDPDHGAIQAYSWTFGSSAYDITGASTATPSCRYSEPGSKTVTLTVTDDEGDTGSATLTVTVRNITPIAHADGPTSYINLSRTSGEAVATFSGSRSYDPDGGALTYSWSLNGGAVPSSSTSSAVTASYSSHGTKTATLTVTDDEGATATDSASVSIKTYPTASAGSDKTVNVDTSVSFSGSGSDADGGTIRSWSWRFGDGSSGTGSSPSHTYTSVGSYTATLTVTDDEGDTDSDTLTVTVKAPPTAEISGGNKRVWINRSTGFSGSGNDPDGGTVTYGWSFGSGAYDTSGATTSSASCKYNSAGNKTVTLTVTDDEMQTASDSITVTVISTSPTANPGSNKTVNPRVLVSFSGSGEDRDGGAIQAYSWTFGSSAYDITGASTATPSCRYSEPGSKTVTLTVTDDEGDTGSATLTVTVRNITPIAHADGPTSYINLSRTSGEAVATFSGSRSYDPDGGALTYSWSLNGGAVPSSSTSSAVTASYSSHGTKTATLTVTDDEGATATDSASVSIKTYPTASAGSDKTVNVDTSVSFSGSGSDADGGTIRSWSWRFGDGSSGTGSSPSHTYTSVGSYTATLTVTDDEGDTDSDTLTVTVKAPPTAEISGGNKRVWINRSTGFSGSGNDPDGGTVTYGWSFGSGAYDTSGATTSSASCKYNSAGNKTVTLTVTDDEMQTASDSITVTVISTSPTANPGSNKTVNPRVLVSFSGSGEDRDGGAIQAYSWTFGSSAYDITGASTATPSCRYSEPGSKTVTLTVTDDEGDTGSATLTVTVRNITPIAHADGPTSYINLSRTSGEAVATFSGSRSYDPDGGALTYSWSLNGGAVPSSSTSSAVTASYSSHGTKTATLTVTDDEEATATDSASVSIKTYPTASAGSDQTVNVDASVNFDGTGSYDADGGTIRSWSWRFGDGSSGTGSSPSHTYTSVGSYTATLTVTDDEGDTDSDSVTITVQDPGELTVEAGSDQTVDVDTTVSFSGSANDPRGRTLSYSWSFGSGAYDIQDADTTTPRCKYDTHGAKTARLTVTAGSGSNSDSASDTLIVTVKAPPTCNDVGDKTVDAGESVSFSVSCSDPDGGSLTYAWSFGDGGTGTGSTASNTYDSHDTYSASVTATDDEGDTATESFTVTVKAPPVAVAGDDQTVDVDTTVNFDGSDSYDPDGGTLTYSWTFGSGAYDIQNAATATPSCKYDTHGAKTARLTVTDDEGDTDSDSVTITVQDPGELTVEAGSDQTVDVDTTVSFSGSANDPRGRTLSYSWSFGSGAYDIQDADTTTPRCKYDAHGAKTVKLTVTAGSGSESASDTLIVTVKAPPVAVAGDDQTVDVDTTVNFDGTGSYDPDGGSLTYSWSFGSGAYDIQNAATATPRCKYDTHGAKTVTLTVTDDEDDTDSDTLTVTVKAPPVAVAGDDQTVDVDTIVNFDGTGSYDPDGGTLTYSWTFGSGAYDIQNAATATPRCKYDAHGSKTVTLTVTDDEDDTDSDTMTVTVKAPPVAVAGDDQTVDADTIVNFDGSDSYDPDGGPLTYAWSFGSGAYDIQDAATATPSCKYDAHGSKTATLTVTDDEGDTDSDTLTVTVKAPPVAVAGDDQTVDVDTTVNFDGTGSYDPDGGSLTYAWTFGSGAYDIQDAATATPSCKYDTYGSKTVRLTVTDDEGDTDSDTLTVTVQDPGELTVEAGSDQTVDVDTTVSFSGSADDREGRTLSYSWSFGSSAYEIQDAETTTPSCKYDAHGSKTVTFTATNDEGDTDTDTLTVTVKAPPVAVAGDDQTVDVDTTVNFDGTGSYDPDGGSLTYSWTFGSGAYDITGASTATPSCKYDAYGSKTVTLTVTDDESDTHSDTLTATVEPAPIVALELSGPDSITRGEIGTYTATITPANLSPTRTFTFRWKYTTSILYDGATEIRKDITATSTNRKSTTWSGEMVKSGTLHVHVIYATGVRLEQTMDVTVNDRDWVTEVPVTTDATYWGIDTPRSLADLAEVEYGIPFDPETDVTTAEVNAGPNEGIKYTDDLDFRAPITIRVNRHLSMIDDDDLPCWAAFRSANSAYADIESKVKSSFGFDEPVNRSLHYRWNNLILHGDMKEAIEEYVRGPDIDLDDYREQVEVYLTGVSASRLTSFEDTVSNWSVRGIQIDYDYLCADAGMDQTVYAGETVNFDGSNSSAPDAHTIDTYAWNFAASATPATGSGAIPSCSFGTAGAYNVTLTITDDQGATAVDTCVVTVLLSVLTANAGDDRTVSVGSPVTFDGSMSYVPPGRTITTYEWNFGDGTTGTGVQPTHTYTTAGAYIVTLTVTDDLGNSATDDATTDAPIATAFNGALSLDTNRIVIPSDSAGRASDAGGATAKSTTPPIVDPPPITTPPIVNPPTVNLPPSTVTITCDVLPAGFTPTSVTAEVHNGTALDATTLVKQFALTETSSGSDSYTGSWDGRNANNARVADGDFQIVGVVNHLADGVQSTFTTSPDKVAVSDGSIQVRILTTSHDYLAGGQDTTAAAITYEIDPYTAVPLNATHIRIVKSVIEDNNLVLHPVLYAALPHPTEEPQTFLWNGKTGAEVRNPPEFVTDLSHLGYGDYDVTVEVQRTPGNPSGLPYKNDPPHQITVFGIEITTPNEDDVFLVGDPIGFTANIIPSSLSSHERRISWSFVAGSGNPSSGTGRTFSSVISNEGDVTIKAAITMQGHTAESELTVTVSEIAVSILASSDSTATVDTVYNHNVLGDTDQTDAARIHYEVTGGNAAQNTTLLFTLEIDDDQDAATAPTTSLEQSVTLGAGDPLARTGYIDWNGRNGDTPLYNTQYAQIKLQVNTDDDAEYEQTILSGFHSITVDAFPAAVAVASVTGETPGDEVTAMLDSTGSDATATVEFNGDGSSDPDGGDIQTYTWDFGDGETGSGVQPSHEYTEAGTYTVKLRVTDNEGHITPEDRADPVTVTVEPKIEVTIDADNSDSYLAANQDTTPAVITYEVNPSVWKEIEPTSENTDVTSPVSIEIKETGAAGMVILTASLPLPTGAAQTYSWDGREENGAETPGDFVEPGVYEVKISVVRDPNADVPEVASEATHQITVFGIDITSADITNDRIHVDLEPANLTGTFTLSLFRAADSENPQDNPAFTHQIRQEEKASGSYDESFNITGLAAGEYRQVIATWEVNELTAADEHDYRIQVLGRYDHTFYNTPDEDGQRCREVAREDPFDYTEGGCRIIHDCETTEAQGRFRWLEERFENGSGLDRNDQIFSGEGFCAPADDVNQRYFVRLSGQTCVFCEPIDNALRAGLDVAINRRNEHLRCNDRVFVHTLPNTAGGTAGGVFTVRDRGGGVGVTEFDHYHGISDCNIVPGNRDNLVTVKLFE